MWLIVLEALGALCVLVFLVWWTMFAGRRQGEMDEPLPEPPDQASLPDGATSRGGHTKLNG
ncbi:MAG: hypothetical protein ACM3VZ_09885 [Acidobacteriota bacterium]